MKTKFTLLTKNNFKLKRINIALLIGCFLTLQLQSISQSFSAKWALSPNQTPVVSGSITASDQTLGSYLAGLSYNQTFLTYTGWQRVGNTSFLPIGYNSNSYIEYIITPNAGNYLKVNSVSLNALGGATGTAVLAAYYSKDNFATSDSLGLATYKTDTVYNATINQPVKLVGGNANYGPTESHTKISFQPYNDIILTPGQTLTVRFYVWITGTGNRYFINKNVEITGITSTSPILPVSFAKISASVTNNQTKINWTVSTETNIYKYEVEKSIDKNRFVTIGSVESNQSHTYNWIDVNSTGESYYRVKALDKDGLYSYSSVVKVNGSSKKAEFIVYPNPVIGRNLNIQVNNIDKGIYTLNLIDGLGKLVCVQNLYLENGVNSLIIKLPNQISNGMYQLMLTGLNNKMFQTILIK